jgi:hypothetical protein
MFYEVSKSRHDEFPVLFGGFVGDGVERVPALFGPRRAVSFGPLFMDRISLANQRAFRTKPWP